jgi:hypothetical protein
MSGSLTRRGLFTGALIATPLARLLSASAPEVPKNSRAQSALDLRKRTALAQSKRPTAAMAANGDENPLPNRIAYFAKGLPQNQFGEAIPTVYDKLLAAIRSSEHEDFERIPRGGGRKFHGDRSPSPKTSPRTIRTTPAVLSSAAMCANGTRSAATAEPIPHTQHLSIVSHRSGRPC